MKRLSLLILVASGLSTQATAVGQGGDANERAIPGDLFFQQQLERIFEAERNERDGLIRDVNAFIEKESREKREKEKAISDVNAFIAQESREKREKDEAISDVNAFIAQESREKREKEKAIRDVNAFIAQESREKREKEKAIRDVNTFIAQESREKREKDEAIMRAARDALAKKKREDEKAERERLRRDIPIEIIDTTQRRAPFAAPLMPNQIKDLISYDQKNSEQEYIDLNLSTGIYISAADAQFDAVKINENGTSHVIFKNVPIPLIPQEKRICRVHSMNDRYFGFTFGQGNVKEKNNNYASYDNLWINRETVFFDALTRNFSVVMQNPNDAYEICDTGSIFPTNSKAVLVKNTLGRYGYLDLETGLFKDALPPIGGNSKLVYDHQPDGTYLFHCMYKTEGHVTTFTDLKKNELLEAGNTINHVLNGNDFKIMDEDKTKVIGYVKNSNGIRVPTLLNLKNKNSTFTNLLTDNESRSLMVDIGDVQFKDHKIYFWTNFEKNKKQKKKQNVVDLSVEKNIYAPAINLQKALAQQQYFSLDFLNRCSMTTEKDFIEKKWIKIHDLIQQAQNIDAPYAHAFKKYNTESFQNFYKNEIMKRSAPFVNTVVKRWIGQIKPDVIDIPYTFFKMPVYTVMANPPSHKFILQYHGGPACRNNNKITLDHMLFTGINYNVVEHNFRGSSGFGTEYEYTLDGNWFNHTREDTDLVIKHLREKEGLPQNALPIAYGGSFGGYAAVNAFVNKQCDRAIAINGLYDLNLQLERNAQDRAIINGVYSPNLYTFLIGDSFPSISPRFGATKGIVKENSLLEKIEKRHGAEMLIIAGSEDTTCLPEQSDRLFEKMKQVGNNVDYFKIIGMGHGYRWEEFELVKKIKTSWLEKMDHYSDFKKMFDEFTNDKSNTKFVYKYNREQ